MAGQAKNKFRIIRTSLVLWLAAAMLVGCGGGMDDLMKRIDEVKARPGGRIDPLPQVKPYEIFAYEAQGLRSPFVPDVPQSRNVGNGPRPDSARPKEYLEQFPLDTLKMVGILSQGNSTYGLVQTGDGMLHKVLPGNYVGQNDGRVVGVAAAEIKVEELVPDGIGGFYRRPAAIGLSN